MLSILRQQTLATRAFSSGPIVLKAVAGHVKLEKAGLPVPPRGVSTSYTLFVTDQFAKNGSIYKNSQNVVDISTVSVSIADAWRSLSDSDKAEYSRKAEEARASYDKEFKKFYNSLLPGQLEQIEKVLGKKLRIPGSRVKAARDKFAASGAPPKPLTPFFVYLQELRTGNGGVQGGPVAVRSFAKDAGAKWRALSDADKKPFFDEAAKQREKYQAWQATQ